MARNNAQKLEALESGKAEFMFTCTQLLAILDITPSVKTRIAFIDILAPRLTDPKDAPKVIALFSYAEDVRLHIS